MIKKRGNILRLIFIAFILSVLYVSSIFISEIISYKSICLSYAYITVISVIYGMLLISEEKKYIIIKWILSLPFSCLTIQYFWKTNYSVRALNWVFPDYGASSAGGNFAGFISALFFSVLCLAGIIASFNIKPDNFKKFSKLQIIIGTVITVIIVSAVILTETQFPPYKEVILNL